MTTSTTRISVSTMLWPKVRAKTAPSWPFRLVTETPVAIFADLAADEVELAIDFDLRPPERRHDGRLGHVVGEVDEDVAAVLGELRAFGVVHGRSSWLIAGRWSALAPIPAVMPMTIFFMAWLH